MTNSIIQRLHLDHTVWVPAALIGLMGVAGWANVSCDTTPPDQNSRWVNPAPSLKWQPDTTTVATFRDGTFRVGIDIPAGTYQTIVPKESAGCRWERRRSPNPESVIAHGTRKPTDTFTVVIKATDKVFIAAGCGTWVRIY
jgi:hypothetical protein